MRIGALGAALACSGTCRVRASNFQEYLDEILPTFRQRRRFQPLLTLIGMEVSSSFLKSILGGGSQSGLGYRTLT